METSASTMAPSYRDDTHHNQHYSEKTNTNCDEPRRSDSELLSLVLSYDWAAVLARVNTHPGEAKWIGMQGRTPLHLACEQDAPAVVIQSLLQAFPEASNMVGTSDMTPLHITCSSQHASVHVVRVLLEQGLKEQSFMTDVDGDTPLHTACRCGAPMEVLEVLLLANAAAVDQRDHEGLTPLLRLWVRYFVILGNDVIENVRHAADLTGELGEAWTKTEVLLHCAHFGSLEYFNSQHTQSRTLQRPDSGAFLVHAASAVDCPRAVVKIATIFYPEQLNQKDELGRTPLMLAAQAPVYKVRDLSDDGYEEDMIYDEIENGVETNENDAGETSSTQPSVIEILIEANQVDASSTACIPDNLGRLPLHATLLAGKKWNEGVKQIVQVFPEALAITEPILSGAATSQLYPFMMAAHGDGADVDTTYELLRHSPQLMNEILEKKKEIAAQNSRLLMEVVEKGLKAM